MPQPTLMERRNGLLAQRGDALDEADALITAAEDEGRDLTSEEEARLRKIYKKADALGKRAERLVEHRLRDDDETDRRDFDPRRLLGPDTEHDSRRDLQPGELRTYGPDEPMRGAWGPSPSLPDGIRREELSLGRALRGIIIGRWEDAPAEHRALQSMGVGTEGGFTVPSILAEDILDRARSEARVMQAGARTLPMDAPEVTISRLDEDPTAVWRGEHGEISESAASFSTATLRAKTLGILVRGSIEWLEDSQDGPMALERAMRAAIALELDRAALFGDGVGEPSGLDTADGVSVEALDGAIDSYAPFSRAFFKVREENFRPSAWIHSVRTERDVDLLTDTTNQPLRPPRSWEAANHFSTTQIPTDRGDGDNESLSFVGQWNFLTIGLRREIVVESARFGDSDAAKKMQVLFRAYLRADSLPMRPKAFAKVTGIQPPAE